MEARIVKLKVVVKIYTDKPIEDIEKSIVKGIYRGLDTPPHYIAQPKDVSVAFDNVPTV